MRPLDLNHLLLGQDSVLTANYAIRVDHALVKFNQCCRELQDWRPRTRVTRGKNSRVDSRVLVLTREPELEIIRKHEMGGLS